ncbi:MAG: hypothetical protein PHR35_22040, partial [Kiritimatiellae bacterium]|nr:hypothetical protein [Kiritimatiellia bacterium]
MFGSESILKAFPWIPHKDSGYGDKEWVTRRYRWRSQALAPLETLWVGIKGIPAAGASSGKELAVDNLRIAVGQSLKVDRLRLLPPIPRAGAAIHVAFDVTPFGGNVSNVMAQLHYRLDGGEWAVTNLFTQPTALTCSTSIVASNVIRALSANTSLDYFVSMHFNGADITSSVVYAPDNAVLDDATGIETITGEYSYVPASIVVQELGNVWINEVYASDDASGHFIELAGLNGRDVSGWSVEIEDLGGGAGGAVYPFGADRHVARNPTGDCAFLLLGGTGITDKDIALSQALPASGGIRLKNDQGEVVDCISYDVGSTTNGQIAAGYVYVGAMSSGQSLAATGEGNPANRPFGTPWTLSNPPTPAAANPGQFLDNTAPVALLRPRADWTISASNMLVCAYEAAELDKPVSYQFTNLTQHVGVEWSTNNSANFGGITENSSQTFVVRAHDSVGNTSEWSEAVSAYTLLNTPAAPTVEATASDTLQISGTVPNLGMGATSNKFERVEDGVWSSGWLVDGIASLAGLDPNTRHGFRAQAKNGDGVETEWSATNAAYTLALTPAATLALDKDGNKILLDFAGVYNPETGAPTDGNPAGTRYAVMAELWFKNGAVATNYIALDGQAVPTNCWALLPVWQNLATNGSWGAQVDITATNIGFRLVAANGDDVPTAPGPGAYTFFEMTIARAGATQILDGEGLVSVAARISNPWTNACNAGLSYSTDDGASWRPATLVDASVAYGGVTINPAETNQLRGIATDQNGTNTVQATWNARTDLGSIADATVWLKWDAEDPIGGKPSDPDIVAPAFAALDLQPPSVQSVVCNQTGPTNANPLTFAVTFSEPVDFTNGAAVTVVNGVVAGVAASPSPSATWAVSVTPAAQGVVTIAAIATNAAADVAGNRSTAWSGSVGVDYDSVAPKVTIDQAAGQADPANASPVVFTVVFDEPVTGFATGDVTVSGTAPGTKTATVTPVSTTTYTVSVSGMTGSGTVIASIGAGKALDAAGNGNEASTSSDNTVTYDVTTPKVTINQAAGQADPTNASAVGFTVVF